MVSLPSTRAWEASGRRCPPFVRAARRRESHPGGAVGCCAPLSGWAGVGHGRPLGPRRAPPADRARPWRAPAVPRRRRHRSARAATPAGGHRRPPPRGVGVRRPQRHTAAQFPLPGGAGCGAQLALRHRSRLQALWGALPGLCRRALVHAVQPRRSPAGDAAIPERAGVRGGERAALEAAERGGDDALRAEAVGAPRPPRVATVVCTADAQVRPRPRRAAGAAAEHRPRCLPGARRAAALPPRASGAGGEQRADGAGAPAARAVLRAYDRDRHAGRVDAATARRGAARRGPDPHHPRLLWRRRPAGPAVPWTGTRARARGGSGALELAWAAVLGDGAVIDWRRGLGALASASGFVRGRRWPWPAWTSFDSPSPTATSPPGSRDSVDYVPWCPTARSWSISPVPKIGRAHV